MTIVRPCRSVLMLMLGLMLLFACASFAQAQKKGDAAVAALSGAVVDDNANLDLEIYLLAASDAAVEGSRLPGLLEPVVRQLRATLPYASYRLSATMMNRMKNGGRLEVSGVGATPFAKVTTPAPLFSEYSVSSVKLKSDAATGQNLVEISDFRFGARVPIQTGLGGGSTAATIQYQNTGIRTEFSMREGEPVIVGTLNVGQAGEAFILVVSAKRTGQR